MLKSISKTILRRIEGRFRILYGDQAPHLVNRLFMLVGRYGVGLNGMSNGQGAQWNQTDRVLITYGDMVRRDGESPLHTLDYVVRERLHGMVNTVHILPFYPYSSDDGFSVIDYRAVDQALGNWSDIKRMGQHTRLMFDLVLNHVSRQSAWFRNYVSGIAPFSEFFIEAPEGADVSGVVRPRSLPLLSETATRAGKRHVWTTFSADQVDLNFANPDVLFEFLDILFWYIAHGARIIRLDAIAYLWKQMGTTCIHLPETHEIVKLFRDVVDMVAPYVLLLTETNVPHEENISYFGEGDEAHMVYQFSLPPLLAHALLTSNASRLTTWAASLPDLPTGQTFFNFTASHDGVGVRPLQGLLSDHEFKQLLQHVEQMGGRISYKQNSDGSESPYELNITYFDLLGEPDRPVTESQIQRFLSSQAIMLAMRGVPAIYFNSLFGARNNLQGAEGTGRHRTINREKWVADDLMARLDNPQTLEHRIFQSISRMLRVRGEHSAFHPDAPQRVPDLGPDVFAIERIPLDGTAPVTSLTNVTDHDVTLTVDKRLPALQSLGAWKDLLHHETATDKPKSIRLAPWQTVWLTRS
jgi:glycosidase